MALFTAKTPILSSRISIYDLNETIDAICALTKDGGAHYVCVSNVHTVVMGEKDPAFRSVTNSATLATADGVPLVWASKVLGKRPIHGRASGPDIMRAFFTESKTSGLRHFLFGSTPEVLSALGRNLSAFPLGKGVVGAYSPPFRAVVRPRAPVTEEELQECERINCSGADVVWVSLGAPKQEIWMSRMRPHLKAKVLIGVGAAFDFLSGNVSRAPVWMQRVGLEWLYRLVQQPSRLFWRYASTNPEFLVRVAAQGVKLRMMGGAGE